MKHVRELLFLGLGALLGIASSGVFWWIQNHLLVPHLEFSPELSKKKNPYTKRGWMYRVKLINRGRRRAVDVSYVVKFAVRGLHYDNLTWIPIPISSNHTPSIMARTGDRVLRFRTDLMTSGDLPYFPKWITEKADAGNLTLDDLMSLDRSSKLIVYVFAYDEFGGARKMYSSKEYRQHDIRKGKFSGLNVVEDDAPYAEWEDI